MAPYWIVQWFYYNENREGKYKCQEVFRHVNMSWHILLMRVVRIKLEMSPFAFNLNMYVLTYLDPVGLLERDLGARSLGFSFKFDVLP